MDLNELLSILKIDRDLTLLHNYYDALKALCESDFFKNMHEKSDMVFLPNPVRYFSENIDNLKRDDVNLDDKTFADISVEAITAAEYWRGLEKPFFDMLAFERVVFDQYFALRRLMMLDDLQQDMLRAALNSLNADDDIEDECIDELIALSDETPKSAVDNKSLDNAVNAAFTNPDAKLLRAAVSGMKNKVLGAANVQSETDIKTSKTKKNSAKKKKKN